MTGGPEVAVTVVIAVVVLGPVIAIGVLCYVWMKNSRASQIRAESQTQEMLTLLREQNELLKRLAQRS